MFVRKEIVGIVFNGVRTSAKTPVDVLAATAADSQTSAGTRMTWPRSPCSHQHDKRPLIKVQTATCWRRIFKNRTQHTERTVTPYQCGVRLLLSTLILLLERRNLLHQFRDLGETDNKRGCT